MLDTKKLVQRARDIYEATSDYDISIDQDAKVLEAYESHGVWVAAWLFVELTNEEVEEIEAAAEDARDGQPSDV